MGNVLWACVVYEEDAKWLPAYLNSVLAQQVLPRCIAVIDSSSSEVVRRVITDARSSLVFYRPLKENLGFNPGLNDAVEHAISGGYEWLATMTVRATPDPAWLAEALLAGAPKEVGMVTTLHVTPDGNVDCLGHNLGSAGQLFEFAAGIPVQNLMDFEDTQSARNALIWGPCSGGALYRVQALIKARAVLGRDDLVRALGFKSYNCDVLAYAIRAAKYTNAVTTNAPCKRDRAGSTSKKPGTAALLLNQEINRIANLFEFWPSARAKQAINLYLQADRTDEGLERIDLRIARTLGEGMSRGHFSGVGENIAPDLEQHLRVFEHVKARRKALLHGVTVRPSASPCPSVHSSTLPTAVAHCDHGSPIQTQIRRGADMTRSEVKERICNKLISIWAIQDALLQSYRLIYLASISILFIFASVLLMDPKNANVGFPIGWFGIGIGIVGLFVILQWIRVTNKRANDVDFIQNQLMYCENKASILVIVGDAPTLVPIENGNDANIPVVTTLKNFENMRFKKQKEILSTYAIAKEVLLSRETVDRGTRIIFQRWFILVWVVIWLILSFHFINTTAL